jgi:aspartate aminotransferase
MKAAYKARHDFVVRALNRIPGIECRPGEGTFYAFPKVQQAIEAMGLRDDIELVERLLNEANVACVPGSAFGAPGYLRMSFACSMDELEESMRRVEKAVTA